MIITNDINLNMTSTLNILSFLEYLEKNGINKVEKKNKQL